MEVTFNVEKIKKVLADFYNCTNITITLFDANLNDVTDQGEWQPYCLEIGNNELLLEKCKLCNKEHALQALNQRGTLIYTCHAGIAEAVSPIFFEDTLVGYLMIGKFRDTDGKYSSLKGVTAAAAQYGLDKETMISAYNELPVLSKSFIDSAVSLLEICLCYICNEEFINIKRNYISTRVEQYIDEHIGEKISVSDICKKFHIQRHLLYAIFDSEFHEGIQQYIITKRIRKAQELLVETDIAVCDISVQLGFSEPGYFIRSFKKKVGETPQQYRHKNKKS